MTLDDAAFAWREAYPRSLWISRATIARNETLPNGDPLTVALAADIYHTAVAELDENAVEALEALREVVCHPSCDQAAVS